MTRVLGVLFGILLSGAAVAQQVPDPLSRSALCPSIVSYGGSPSATDNTSAFNNAVAAATSGRVCVSFPPGVFRFQSLLAVTLPAAGFSGFTLQGSGPGVTILNWPGAGGGLTVTLQHRDQEVRIAEVELTTGAAGGGTALTVANMSLATDRTLQPVSNINHVNIHGSDGYSQAYFWNTAIKLDGMSNVNIVGSNIAGAPTVLGPPTTFTAKGIDISGTSVRKSAQINLIGVAISCVNTGLIYGDYVEGVTVSGGSNFVCGTIGIDVAGASARDELTVVGNSFNTDVAGIRISYATHAALIAENVFILGNGTTANATGIQLVNPGGSVHIANNNFQSGGPNSTGIRAEAPAGGLINGNSFQYITTGISLADNTQMRVTNDNRYLSGLTTNVAGYLTNKVDGVFSWTPTLYGSTTPGTPTYTANIGLVTRNGSNVTASFTLTATALGGAAGDLRIGNLPLPSSSYGNCFITGGGVQISAGLGTTQFLLLGGLIEPAATAIKVYLGSAANTGVLVPLNTVNHVIGPAINWFGTCHLIN